MTVPYAPGLVTITLKELAVLAPFIDQKLQTDSAGDATLTRRIAALRDFKKRILQQKILPDSTPVEQPTDMHRKFLR
jgi:hypothetical protein